MIDIRIKSDVRMIHYQLRCDEGHEFDGWFKDSTAFEKQAKRGLLECPHCGATAVTRALMAPSVPRKGNAVRQVVQQAEPAEAAEASPPQPVAGGRMPAQVRAMLQRLRTEVEKNCDYVGEQFAEEARKIHRGETERRGIYGEASVDDAKSLAEEGIEVSRIPWVPRADG